MEKANMLDGSLYVEFGAGRAGLSSYVSSGCQNKHAVFLAIDRDSRRFKLDKEIKANGFDSIREKMDIADFDLVKWLSLRPATAGVIGIAKHLCGGATDLSLTAFEHLEKGHVTGLSIATCCHHSCDTKTYVALPFISKCLPQLCGPEAKVCPIAFQKFVRCSSWAVCPQVAARKRAAGFKVKRLIDLGRLLHIREVIQLK